MTDAFKVAEALSVELSTRWKGPRGMTGEPSQAFGVYVRDASTSEPHLEVRCLKPDAYGWHRIRRLDGKHRDGLRVEVTKGWEKPARVEQGRLPL